MTHSLMLLFAVGVATGVTTVLFGFGGGFVTVPAVFTATRTSGSPDAMHVAVATSTAVMVVNAGWATVNSARRGLIDRRYLWPISAYAAIGAALGALAARWTPESLLHILFVAYIVATMVDSVIRRGFMSGAQSDQTAQPLSSTESTLGGIVIGAVASYLGVGGSVVTVPLLRRKGLTMASATALANPLSVPVAAVASVVYAVGSSTPSGAAGLGFVDLSAGATLLAGSLPTIALARRVLTRFAIPDRVHAVMYLALLGVVVVTMTVTVAG